MSQNNHLINSKPKSLNMYIIKNFLFFILTVTSYASMAQNKINNGNFSDSKNSTEYYRIISFGDKIDFGSIEASVRWNITNTTKGIGVILNGSQINDYIFQQSGEYEIQFSETKKQEEECNHPAFPEKIIIRVNPVKLSFDFSKIEFSQKIRRGIYYENLIVSVPVKSIIQSGVPNQVMAPGLLITGIGVSLLGEPVNERVEIKNGTQVFKYKISGRVDKDTYLMFDFYNLNDEVQSFNLQQIIK